MPRKMLAPEERKKEFLKTARELFNERGFESTSVEDIVRKMGVAKGLFYYYFNSKDELMNHLIEEFLEETRQAVEEVAGKKGLTAIEKIDSLFDVSAEIRRKSGTMVAYFHRPQNRYLHMDLERKMLEHIVPVLEDIIRQGVSEGVFDTRYPKETAIAYLAAASALAHRYMDLVKGEDLPEYVAMFQYITERLFGSKPGVLDLYHKRLTEKIRDADVLLRSQGRREA